MFKNVFAFLVLEGSIVGRFPHKLSWFVTFSLQLSVKFRVSVSLLNFEATVCVFSSLGPFGSELKFFSFDLTPLSPVI